MQTLRTFIALELCAKMQQRLKEIQQQLKQAGADVKWVNPEGIHLTLKFLGEISLELIEEIKKQIDLLVKDHHSFTVGLSQLGAFPNTKHPRVIWIDIGQGKSETISLAGELQQVLLNLGFLEEKRSFKPHLTLGRVHSGLNREQLCQLLQSTTVVEETMQADSVVLFKSTLTPQGALYLPLHKAQLS